MLIREYVISYVDLSKNAGEKLFAWSITCSNTLKNLRKAEAKFHCYYKNMFYVVVSFAVFYVRQKFEKLIQLYMMES